MAESDRSGSFENDSILSGLVYSLAEVSDGDASSVASLSLSLGDIWPYCFEPEQGVDLEMSTSSEAEEILKMMVILAKSIWVIEFGVYKCSHKVILHVWNFSTNQVQVWSLPTNANGKRVCLPPRNRKNQSIVGWQYNFSVYYTAARIF